ncbi:MAG: type II secretion system F family protein [Candidatus Bathyarchaeota archaeon]|nr:type II secretion system F family protein [Candidatus Bathyarchaeota archaeon]
MELRDFCYAHFSRMGQRLSRVFHGLENDLDAAYMRVHPDVYFSMISFAALLSLTIPTTLIILALVGLWPQIPSIPFNGLILIPISALIPLIVVLISIVIPKSAASNRVAGLKTEIPYASMYISVMTSGGISPFESLLRLRHTDLLPNMQKEIARVESIVTSTGVDPVTAMEQAARVVKLDEYKELLLGYASMVRTGGDTLHYLFNQTSNMFKNVSARIRTLGENMGVLMEAYTIVGVLGVLGLFLIFVIGMALPAAGLTISTEQFILFSYVILPIISLIFLYLSDMAQISYPLSSWKPYLVFVAFLPLGCFMATQLVLPFYDERFLFLLPAKDLVISIRTLLNLSDGTESAIGMAITLTIIALPGLVGEFYYARKEGSLHHGITLFLRDLVETRKSGLGPERCIEDLSSRDYQAFSKHLQTMSLRLSWGFPIRQIYEEFRAKVRDWLSLISIYLLIDTIEVGGGSEESLETLADFAKTTEQLENEKRAMLMPLGLVPYIGAGLLTGTTVMFLNFLTGMSFMGVTIPYVDLFNILLPPLLLHSFILGIVAGKIMTGRASAGFKHSIVMVLVGVAGIWVMSNMTFSMGIGG